MLLKLRAKVPSSRSVPGPGPPPGCSELITASLQRLNTRNFNFFPKLTNLLQQHSIHGKIQDEIGLECFKRCVCGRAEENKSSLMIIG